MKESFVLFCLFSFLYGYSCEELIKKYNAPNPKMKTMKQLKRWANEHLKDNPQKDEILECLIENAADNPNQETTAAE